VRALVTRLALLIIVLQLRHDVIDACILRKKRWRAELLGQLGQDPQYCFVVQRQITVDLSYLLMRLPIYGRMLRHPHRVPVRDGPGYDSSDFTASQRLVFRKEIRMGVHGCLKQHGRSDPQGDEVGRSFCAVLLSTTVCDPLNGLGAWQPPQEILLHTIVSCDLSASWNSQIAIGHAIEAVDRNFESTMAKPNGIIGPCQS
jgi:hypothetical protein